MTGSRIGSRTEGLLVKISNDDCNVFFGREAFRG